jgi:hypothetical protein
MREEHIATPNLTENNISLEFETNGCLIYLKKFPLNSMSPQIGKPLLLLLSSIIWIGLLTRIQKYQLDGT